MGSSSQHFYKSQREGFTMKLTHIFQVSIVVILSFQLTNADNILFLSFPYYGHINPMVKVAGELTRYGHNSYIGIPESFKGKFSPAKKEINYFIIEEFPELPIFNALMMEMLRFKPNPPIQEAMTAYRRLCDRYLLNEGLFSKLKLFNTSLAVIDANFMSNCLAVFAYRLQIPFILQGLHNQINIHRTPWSISMSQHLALFHSNTSSLWGRLKHVRLHLFEYMLPALGTPSRNIKAYAPERPDITFDELIRQAELYIIDSDFYMNPPFPALPNVKYIGGLASQPARPLKGKILEFVSSSRNGVIVVSPGSTVSWDDRVKKLEIAFSKTKYDVVWKHSSTSFSLPNVLQTEWLPQNDVLGHPNTKLFITHCGNSGRYESLYNGVPMIGLPVLGDQPMNCLNMQLKGFGISMNFYNFTVDELVSNIEEVIENPKYKRNIVKTSEIFRSHKELPSEKAARLVDHVLKYGGDHLRSDIQNIPMHQFLMLDIWAVIFVVGFVILNIAAFILLKCCSIAGRRKKTKIE